ncbi:MAG: cob(I)yrinic acid a,c-diamide adenosyltransferase [Bacteroidales bacterium]|nr:cob(I)yrinic acid a,c-diamide adenosyltransferase [Bacteroidales bacterium]
MIYTKTGDKGTTSLVGGTRVSKCDIRVEAYGTVDELNSHVGLLAEMIKGIDPEHYTYLKTIQNNLFIVQTLLATEKELPYELPNLPANAVAEMEQAIDTLQSALPPFRCFVIPGGNIQSAQCHVARTVCRRAERCIVALTLQAPVDDEICRYINRLSDYLFILSRHLVIAQGDEESLYK